jgi:hypothetical protein
LAPKRAFAPGANDEEAGSSRRIVPALRAACHRDGLYIEDAGRGAAALAQPVPPVPKLEEDDGPDMCVALAASLAEEKAKWPQLAAVLRTSAMEEEARQAVEDAKAWASLSQARQEEEARLRHEEARRHEDRRQAEQERHLRLREEAELRAVGGGQPSEPPLGQGRGLVVAVAGVPGALEPEQRVATWGRHRRPRQRGPLGVGGAPAATSSTSNP